MAAILPPVSAKREKLPPVRQPNQASRTREHLTPEKSRADALLERIGKTACICQRHAAMKAVK
jgi:hypothetical protein